MFRRLLFVCALAGSTLAGAGSASGATTIGSDLAAVPDTFLGCGVACLRVQDVLPGRTLAAPSDGVIVRWRARVGDGTEAQSIRIRVVRRLDADRFTVVSSSDFAAIPAGAGSYTFATKLPVQSGDQFGAEGTPDAEVVWGAEVVGAHFLDYVPSPLDGGTTPAPGPAG